MAGMALEFYQFPYGSDNYGVLVHDGQSGETACVDAGDAQATLAALAQTGWQLGEIWITHHHADHTAGLAMLKSQTGARVIGPDLAHVDQIMTDGDTFSFAGRSVGIIETPGHTLEMLNFYIEADGVVFTGDTLFVMGCGRLSEGSPAQMHASLQKLVQLPAQTTVYCSHEYTAANAAFALSVDGANPDLVARAAEVDALRAAGKPTVPTSLALELATNPFLRAGNHAIRQGLGLLDATDEQVFTQLRARKDSF